MFKALLMSVIVVTSATAWAGLHVEPGITYENSDNKLDWPAPFADSSGETMGLGVNLKLGWVWSDSIFAAVDGMYSKPTFKNSATHYDADANSSLLAATLGAQMPIAGLRIWGGYVFDGTLDPDESGGYDVKFEKANGYKVGAGFRILLVSLNLEYYDIKYKDSILESGSITGNLDQELESQLVVFSVSMPLSF